MNVSTPSLYERAIKEYNSRISSTGALVAYSGSKTGRCPKDKRIVKNKSSEGIWWGNVNIPISQDTYNWYLDWALEYMNENSKYYVVDGYAGWDTQSRVGIRVYCYSPYHALFMKNMLIKSSSIDKFVPDFIIYNLGHLDLPFPSNSDKLDKTLIGLDLKNNNMLIYGTEYAGEMKKGILTLMMYLMPLKHYLPLHSSCNTNRIDNQVSLFFGLSGTGKTTLSADTNRNLIGDDEHVWTDDGVFNIEGGCYAKCINLSKEDEPEIYNAIKFGAVLENTIMNNEGTIDYYDTSITTNTRASYPLEFIENSLIPAVCSHPNNIILLTCDAFGLLPPVSRLTPDQAVFQFVCGYTSKTPGTEVGITEPVPVFSSCFGEPFIVWSPSKYGQLLKEKLEQHNTKIWLVNTGWVGGAYGVGKRISIKYSRAIIDAIHNNTMNEFEQFNIFDFEIPVKCEGVPSEILNPANVWSDKNLYYEKLQELYGKFLQNYALKIE